jgi:DNA polymerase-3 subunit delta
VPTLAAVRAQIAEGKVASLYMLVGEDETEKSALAADFAGLVEEGLEAFNLERLYGGETKADALIEAASQLPMMAPRRVVIVMEAEKLLVPKRESKAADAEQERLEQFLPRVPAHVTLVFVCGTLDERRRAVKILRQHAQVVDCGTIEDAAAATAWVKSRAAKEGAALDAGAVRTLVERAGPDITRLRAGLERVMLYALGQPSITAEDVRQAVPAAPEAQEDFGIANAIRRSDAAGALRELGLALDAGAVPFLVLGQLRIAAERIPGPKLHQAIQSLFDADLALKSSAGEPRIVLERLVLELCAANRSGGGPGRPGFMPGRSWSR